MIGTQHLKKRMSLFSVVRYAYFPRRKKLSGKKAIFGWKLTIIPNDGTWGALRVKWQSQKMRFNGWQLQDPGLCGQGPVRWKPPADTFKCQQLEKICFRFWVKRHASNLQRAWPMIPEGTSWPAWFTSDWLNAWTKVSIQRIWARAWWTRWPNPSSCNP